MSAVCAMKTSLPGKTTRHCKCLHNFGRFRQTNLPQQASLHSPHASADPKADVKPKERPAPKERKFSNKQVFIVPEEVQPAFEEAWRERESYMKAAPGFDGFVMDRNGTEYSIVSKWRSIPEWESLNLSKPYRRSHLPNGIWQRVPKPGEGFPEDFVPFMEMNTFVQAKY